MILIILLAVVVWYLLQMILNAAFSAVTGSKALGKVLATVAIIVILAIYSANN